MKTLRRLIVSPRKISLSDKRQRNKLRKQFLNSSLLEVQDDYRIIPELLDAKLEKTKNDLDEKDIQSIVSDYSYHWIHVVYTPEDWDKMGVRDSLRGQSRLVGNQVITYGKWTDSAYDVIKQHTEVFSALSEHSLGEWHEGNHGFSNLFDVPDLTHFHFYGYHTLDSTDRYERTPTPDIGWDNLPWENLTELVPNKQGLRIIKRYFYPLEDYSWNKNSPQSIVLHTTGGYSVWGAITNLLKENWSYHFIVEKDAIYQLIPIDRAAWHAGIVHNPTTNLFIGNPNKESIGIAYTNNINNDKLDRLAKLVKHCEDVTGETYDNLNIVTHQMIDSGKPKSVNNTLKKLLARIDTQSEEELRDTLIQQIINKIKSIWR